MTTFRGFGEEVCSERAQRLRCIFCGSAVLAYRERVGEWVDQEGVRWRTVVSIACETCRARGPGCDTEQEAAERYQDIAERLAEVGRGQGK